MPAYDYAPRFALSAYFDAREWVAATALLTRNGTTTSATAGSAVIHGDAIDFLNGRGSDPSAEEALEAQAANGWTATIDANDQVTISAAVNFRVANTTDNRDVFGFTQALPTGDALTHTAQGQWLRGNQSALLTLQGAGGAPTYRAPNAPAAVELTYQSIPAMLRSRGASLDIDDVTGDDCLEQLEQVAHGGAIRWGVTVEGYVYWEVDDTTFASAAAATPTWDSTALRDRLGFDGSEVTQDLTATRGVYRGEAACRLPGFITPSRPLRRLDSGDEAVGSSARKRSTTRYRVDVAQHRLWSMDWLLDGQKDLDDLSQHWQDFCVPYFTEGAPVTLYQDWGDTRRAGRTCRGEVYGLLYTVEIEPYRGRLLLQFSEAAAQMLNMQQRLRRRYPMSCRFEEP